MNPYPLYVATLSHVRLRFANACLVADWNN